MKLYSAIFESFSPFNSFYPDAECIPVIEPEKITDADGALIIWGGADIHPSFYNRPNIRSYVQLNPSQRDQVEARLFARAVELGMPIIGVCRGAQLGCALSGGVLVQDVTGHGSDHRMITIDGRTFVTSSLHHQMLFPWDVDHELIAWAPVSRSRHYEGITEEEMERWPRLDTEPGGYVEPEVVWFPKTKCLAIQGHPEFLPVNDPYNQYIRELTEKYVQNVLHRQ